jgi:hypothetical protein
VSYDLYLMAEHPGEDPMDVLERLEEDERPPTPEEAARNERLGAALQAALPGLEDNAGDASVAGEVHLMDPDGLEVSVYVHSVAVTFPYWDSLEVPKLVADLEKVAAVVEEQHGWGMYDPQQERWIDPLRDADGLRDAFDVGRAAVRRIVAEQEQPRTTPWWRRLGRRGDG